MSLVVDWLRQVDKLIIRSLASQLCIALWWAVNLEELVSFEQVEMETRGKFETWKFVVG